MNQTIMCGVLLLSAGHAALTWAAEPVRVLAPGTLPNARQPQVAVSPTGDIHIAFGSEESLYCSSSTNGGKSYEEPVEIGRAKKLGLGMRRGPRIAAGRKALVVTAVSHEEGNVLAWRSTDQGRTWSGPVTVNDNTPGTANEGLHAMALAPNGDLYCVWLDHRLNQENQIFGAASRDGGKTWGENRLIYRSPSGGVCPCCHPAVTFDSEGTLYVMWRNSLEGFRDMFFSQSRDRGQTFTPAQQLGRDKWKLDSCPMDGGYLAAVKPGRLVTVWRRQNEIYRTDSPHSGEQRLGTGEQPWATATPAGAWLVWLSKRGGDLFLSSPHASQPHKLASHAIDPVIAAPVLGTGPVVVAWEAGHGHDRTLMAAVAGSMTQ